MTRRAFTVLLACLPLSWQVKLGAYRPHPRVLEYAARPYGISGVRLRVLDGGKLAGGIVQRIEDIPDAARQYSRIYGYDPAWIESQLRPGITRVFADMRWYGGAAAARSRHDA